MNDHFFITLPSDSSEKYYPDNTVARFVTKLPETIRLQGNYEMALVEIIYPHTWYNIDNSKYDYWYVAVNKKTYIQSGYYEDGTAFLETLNNPEIGTKFSYNRTTGRLSLTFRSTGTHTFQMSHDLQNFTGFTDLPTGERSFNSVAERDFDVNRGLNLMYVYCDIASHSIVGDTKAPLLRVCNVSGKHRDYVRYTYTQPHYVPVGRHEFDAIEIAIYNELGKPMPFQYGKSVVTIHFRRRWTITSI